MTTLTTPRDGTGFLLPPRAYTSTEWWEAERATLFADVWTPVTSTGELPDPGSYLATEAGPFPVVLVRDEGGTLRAWHNLCRHRGMVMLQGSGRLDGHITCSYHRWRYGLDGALTAVPQRREQFPGICADDLGLLPASVAEWEGLVWVHPDGAAAPLADALAGVADGIGSFRPGLLRQAVSVRIEAACNWKLLVENHVDVYHLWYLHERSLGDFDHLRFTHRRTGGNWASYEPYRANRERPSLAGDGAAVEIDHLDERDRDGIGAHLVFPNVMIATTAEFFATYVARPVAPERTVVELRIRAPREADAERLLGQVRAFLDEDIVACEAVAAGLRSPAFSVGALAERHEAPITDFHTSLLAAMEPRPA